jgi:hypothetical protein
VTPVEIDGTAEDWIGALPRHEAETIRAMSASGKKLDAIALTWLTKAGPDNTFPFGGESVQEGFYQRIKEELHKLICGDPSYEKLRKQIAGQLKQHKGKVVGMIAAAVGAIIGLAAVALVPVVAIILSIVAEVGVNAWCKAPAT